MRSATRMSETVAGVGPRSGIRLLAWGLATLLILLSVFTFWPVLENDFVDLDDENGFVKNRHLVEPAGDMIRWALTEYYQGVYIPLSRPMYWAEAWFWGITPKGFHAVSIALHAVNAVVLFALTVALLRLGRPAMAAERPRLLLGLAALSVGLFVVHPLRAEIVAWTTSQGYEPSLLFGMLSVLAYLRANRAGRFGRVVWLGGSVALFAASLGFYAITVCVPLVLLLLDVYPLRRIVPGQSTIREALWILAEKLPYVPLGLAFAVTTYQARMPTGTVTSLGQDGVVSRVAASCYATCFYLAKTLLPVGVGPIHPMPGYVGLGEARFLLSVLAVAAISILAFRLRRKWPALAAVWASFLLLQLPCSGVVRFASTIAADRYTYITMVGFPVLMAVGRSVLVQHRPRRSTIAVVWVAGGIAVVALIGLSRQECLAWHDSVSIWSHVAEAHGAPEGFFESRIGRALADRGRPDEAEIHLREAIRLSPGLAYAHGKLGLVLVAKGQTAEAFREFAEAVRQEPKDVESRLNLGYALAQLGHPNEAAAQFAEAVRLRPELPDAQANLGAVLVQLGRPGEAEGHLAEALRLAPDRPGGRMDLGYALAQQKKFDQAAELYAEEVRLHPDDQNARHNLAFILEQLRR
jgi:Flp pilus assembly protein TadD